MKEYTFKVPVTGFEFVTVKAENVEDAVDKVNFGDGEQLNLDVDWVEDPNDSHVTDVEEV